MYTHSTLIRAELVLQFLVHVSDNSKLIAQGGKLDHHKFLHTQMSMHIQMVRVHTQTYIHTSEWYMYTYAYIHTHEHIHIYTHFFSAFTLVEQ